MNEFLLSFIDKLPTVTYPLSLNSTAHKDKQVELKLLLENTPDINQENLYWWSLLLQKIKLEQFSLTELITIVSVNVINLMQTDYVFSSYSLKNTQDILYARNLELSQDLDIKEIDNLYQQQIKPSYYFSKTFIKELLINI